MDFPVSRLYRSRRFCKPMPEAFTIALKLLGERPETTMMVDDSFPNIVAAHALGMRTVWVTTKPQAFPADFVIPAACDLPSVFSFDQSR